MGTILFFPYSFFIWKLSQFFLKTVQFYETHGKDSLGWILFFFFLISAYEGKSQLYKSSLRMCPSIIHLVWIMNEKQLFLWYSLCLDFFKYLALGAINRAYSGTRQVIEKNHSLLIPSSLLYTHLQMQVICICTDTLEGLVYHLIIFRHPRSFFVQLSFWDARWLMPPSNTTFWTRRTSLAGRRNNTHYNYCHISQFGNGKCTSHHMFVPSTKMNKIDMAFLLH